MKTEFDMSRLGETVERELRRYDKMAHELKSVAEAIHAGVSERLLVKWRDARRPTPPLVYCRVKPRDSVKARIEERYSRLEEFPDLIGCRVVVLHSKEIDEAEASLRGYLNLGAEKEISFYAAHGRAGGYSGCYWDDMTVSSLSLVFGDAISAQARATECKWELQIHTAMQEAWSRLSHERFYKSRVGVPRRTSLLLRRLAAVTDLIDEQFVSIERHLETESADIRGRVRSRRGRDNVEIDEYVLLLAADTWDRRFLELRDLGRAAGFRHSEWTELVRIGDETDLCVSICERTGISTLGEFLDAVKEMLESVDEVGTVEKLMAVVAATGDEPGGSASIRAFFDRPLFVFSLVRLLQFPNHVDAVAPLRGSIRAALKRVAL